MADWKYIMWEANGAKVPVLFPNVLIHSDVADMMSVVIRDHVITSQRSNWSSQVISAGFISQLLVTGVHGKSETLELGSDEGDRSIINTWPYTNGQEDLMGIEPLMFEAFKRAMED